MTDARPIIWVEVALLALLVGVGYWSSQSGGSWPYIVFGIASASAGVWAISLAAANRRRNRAIQNIFGAGARWAAIHSTEEHEGDVAVRAWSYSFAPRGSYAFALRDGATVRPRAAYELSGGYSTASPRYFLFLVAPADWARVEAEAARVDGLTAVHVTEIRA